MSDYEVPEPILNSPFEAPAQHWHIVEGEDPVKRAGRRRAIYYYRDPKARNAQGQATGVAVELELVNRIRDKVEEWRRAFYPGASATTRELLEWWTRDGRDDRKRLFFAQVEAGRDDRLSERGAARFSPRHLRPARRTERGPTSGGPQRIHAARLQDGHGGGQDDGDGDVGRVEHPQ